MVGPPFARIPGPIILGGLDPPQSNNPRLTGPLSGWLEPPTDEQHSASLGQAMMIDGVSTDFHYDETREGRLDSLELEHYLHKNNIAELVLRASLLYRS